MTNNKISVIMLTYNRETLIERAIKSILNQTLIDFEFIIIDNGSSDRSGIIADEYALIDSRIHVIHRKCGNIGSGRNVGLDVANGEYISFIDDDDYAEPDFLEFLYNLVCENHAEISICGAMDKAFDKKLVMSAEEALIELMRRKYYNMAFPTKLFTRELKKTIRFPENDKFDDISQMYRLLASAKSVAYHGLPKYTFYRHEGNNSAWTVNHSLLTKETLDEYLCAYRERTKWLSKYFPSSSAAWCYFEWSFMISMVEKIDRYRLTDCAGLQTVMLQELSRHSYEFLNGGYIQEFEKEWLKQYVEY